MAVKFNVRRLPSSRATCKIKRASRQSRLAVRRVLNKQIRKTRTRSSREIRGELSLKKDRVDASLDIEKATLSNLAAKVVAKRRGVLLSRFPNRQLTRRGKTKPRVNAGISVRVKKGGSFQKLKTGFKLQLKSGNKRSGDDGGEQRFGIAIRTGSKPKDIKVLHGPSTSQALDTLRSKISAIEEPVLRAGIQQEIRKLVR